MIRLLKVSLFSLKFLTGADLFLFVFVYVIRFGVQLWASVLPFVILSLAGYDAHTITQEPGSLCADFVSLIFLVR